MRFFSPRKWLIAWVACVLCCCSCTAEASTTFDGLPALKEYAQQLTTTNLSEALSLYVKILAEHNVRKESPALRTYVAQLQTVLQPDCCDYFTALPAVKGLAAALGEVLAVQLPAALRPVVRRSYLAAIWLLQRSKYFKWNSGSMQKAALSGMYKLYDHHMDAVAGRAISFHHISKTGGTSLCTVAWENGCRGPSMSKKNNCMLDSGLDRPIWVLRHDVTTANNLTAVPQPPPPPSPTTAITNEAARRIELAAATQQLLRGGNYDWFMYDCPADRMAGKVGRPCNELQEGAVSKSATFFANENTLPTEHGNSQVCEAFTNVVIVRDAVSATVSLMTEVSLVYSRLLKQHRVLGWGPPTWDLTWWQQRAPAVTNSYATRTLLGAPAFCPPVKPAPASTAQPGQPSGGSSTELDTGNSAPIISTGSNSSAAGGPVLPLLSAEDVHKALQTLASFDVVLDLSSQPLADASLAKLLGWSAHTFSTGQLKRTAQVLFMPTWEQLELLARQQAPKPPHHPQTQAAGISLCAGAVQPHSRAPTQQGRRTVLNWMWCGV